jgi:hypothetical protein
MLEPQKMVKVRVISQRYGGPNDFMNVRQHGGERIAVSMNDKPLVNESTGEPLINGGSFARVDPNQADPRKRSVPRQWRPGEVLEMPEDEAIDQIRLTPNVLELESIYQARLERIAKRDAAKPGEAWELAAAMDQTTAEDEASRRFQAMAAEKKAKDLAAATAALHPSHDKDRIIEQQQQQLSAMQEQLSRLEELVTRPAANGAQS